jgi:hypothetical protein
VPDRGEPDAEERELEEAVEAEYQKGVRAYRASLGSGRTVFATSRKVIRKRLIAERREAREDRIRDLDEREARARVAEAEGRFAQTEGEASANRYGKEYPGAVVEEVVRLATQAEREGRRHARTLRDELAAKTDATPYAVDTIFRLMRSGKLADAGRRGWLKVADEISATPSFINLHELETRS